MRQMFANLARNLFGPTLQEENLKSLVTDAMTHASETMKDLVEQRTENARLRTILYRPNEKIADIRQPLLDAITACQGEPIMEMIKDPQTGEEEPQFAGMSPPDLVKIKQKIEVSLSACDKAVKEQTKGIDGP